MSKPTNKLLLGQLVIDLGWVSPTQINQCLDLAEQIEAPIGNVLVSEGYISEPEMRSLILAQSMMRDGHLTLCQASKALSFSAWWSMPLPEVLTGMGLKCGDKQGANKLGELLLASGWIDEETLAQATSAIKIKNIQLGEYLITKNLLSKSLLSIVLDLQILIRNKSISKESAIAAMMAIPRSLLGLATTASVGAENLRLGQLLVDAKIISQAELLTGLERSLTSGRPLGEVLLIFGLITEKVLEAALRLQMMTIKQTLTAREAAFSLYRTSGVDASGRELVQDRHTAPLSNLRGTPLAFLQLVKGLDSKTLKRLREISNDPVKCKQLYDDLDCNIAQAATRCSFLFKRSALTLEQAAFAFHYSRINRSDVEQFLLDSGWINESKIVPVESDAFNLFPQREIICA